MSAFASVTGQRDAQDFRSPGPAEVRLRHPRAADVRHRRDCVRDDREECGRSRCSSASRCSWSCWRLHSWLSGEFRCSPEPRSVLTVLTAPVADNPRLPWVLIPLLIVFYAGELVWRERDAGLSEIADATAGTGMGLSSWASSWD